MQDESPKRFTFNRLAIQVRQSDLVRFPSNQSLDNETRKEPCSNRSGTEDVYSKLKVKTQISGVDVDNVTDAVDFKPRPEMNISLIDLIPSHLKMRIPSHRSGNASCHPRIFEVGVSYYGLDTLSGRFDLPTVDAEACCRQCLKVSRCTHWSWIRGDCMLKNGRLVPIRSPWEKSVVSAHVATDLRSDRLLAPPQSDGTEEGLHCEWDAEDASHFLSSSPAK